MLYEIRSKINKIQWLLYRLVYKKYEYLFFRLELLITLEKPYADRYTDIT